MKVRLGDYIKEYSVRNKAEEDIPVYSVTNTQGFCRDYFGKEVASKDKSTYKIVPRGCFAYNPSRINVGSVDWQRFEERVIVSPLYNVFSVGSQLDQQYLYYYLKSDFALQRIRTVATGSVRDNLKLAMLYEFPIELPNVKQQRELASRLDKVKKVMSLREQELQVLDELIKARFVEMFGEPIANPKRWPVKCLKELSSLITNGTTPKGGSENYVKHGIMFLRSQNVWRNRIELDDVAFIDEATHNAMSKSSLHHKDILITKTGRINTENSSLGRAALFLGENDSANINGHVYLVRLKDFMVPEFVTTILTGEAYRKYIRKVCVGGIDKRQIKSCRTEIIRTNTNAV